MTYRLLLSGLALVLLAGALWGYWRGDDTPTPSLAPAPPSQPVTAEDPTMDAAPRVTRTAPRPSLGWETPLAPNLEAWRETAKSEPDEALALADRLSMCHAMMAMDPAAQAGREAADRERLGAMLSGQSLQDALAGLESRIDRSRQRRSDCESLGPGVATEMLRHYERAARESSDPDKVSRARLQFVINVFADMPSIGDLIAGAEEAARRRDLARAWLIAERDAGNEQALRLWLENMGADNGLFPRVDHVDLHAWFFVEAMREARRMGGVSAERAFWDHPSLDRWFVGTLDSEAVAQALARGREHYQRIFGPPGG